MSWIFGKSSTSSTTTTTSTTTNNNDQSTIKQTLGFDPKEVTDVNTIISTPGAISASRLHPLAGLDKGIEYLDLEEEQLNTVEGSKGLIPSRSWTDDLCYGTGAIYLLGLGIGGLYGFQQGLKTLPNSSIPFKVKLNHILNNITKRGPFLGNNAGVLALTYNLIDSTIDGIREKHDDLNSVISGALAGALFKSSAGLKPMTYSSVMMAGVAGIWCGLKRFLQE
ncbi:membrane import machinery protein, putative [Candida dubliniensis CD36]|uniref:Mitochondrial import inner membrane translocase subunit TIM23 n=1 Tax=Candida dubliniensis (strain CD36 / ATCC MYA-646 / CBS 7987 / NCPF 3949 / NRRL Y-17841) TaxID=573826 RepID=B9WCQ5_CANDC|nr:membrane import machinery protein, putative [Candida dubliniensis CD36]CAX44178.1 membrane import machinery protein, putative [Candida dubliniensis CD36]